MIVRFDDVAFRRNGGPPILSRFNLTIASGEIVAIVGRSGAGKTTVLKLVNRLLLPSAGRVLIDDAATTQWDGIRLRRRIGYVFQDVGLFPHMTIEENVMVVPRLEGWDEARARTRARELLDLVGLPPATFASRRPAELSGGQRQRVGLARALAIDPPVLLMDEPFGALDPVTRLEMRREFKRIHDRIRMTVILVTHDMAEAFTLGDRIGVIDGGELIACDTPDVVATSQDSRVRAFIETAAPATWPPHRAP